MKTKLARTVYKPKLTKAARAKIEDAAGQVIDGIGNVTEALMNADDWLDRIFGDEEDEEDYDEE